jgi:uncharacterized protein YceK
MRALLLVIATSGLLGTGCATVTSSMGGMNNSTGEAWYTEAKGFLTIKWGSKVYYCPPPQSGPATCKEAKMIALTKAELDAQKEAETKAEKPSK